MNRIKFIFISCVLLILQGNLSAQDNPLWLRYPSISPDGQTILFNYRGDIFKVPATGGTAVPISLSDGYEYSAVWSHDGRKIAFASDRYGNFDVFVMPAEGGEAKRLTYHSNNEKPSSFTIDDTGIIFSALRQDLHTNVQFPVSVMEELYMVPVEGGRVSQVLTSPAHDATYSPDGNKLIFHDRKGYENEWRKHHTSAVTRDIWLYDLNEETYKQLTLFEGEDRNPVFKDNNNEYYYLSEQTGSFNIHLSSLTNPNENIAITSFEKHPVRFLSRADDNTLCFSFHGEIYTMKPESEPNKVDIEISYDGLETLEELVSVNKDFTEISLSPNGKEFAYVFRGEIFISSIENGTTKRITNTPWQERSVDFSPDGRSIVYAAEVDTSWNIYTKSIIRDVEPYFFMSTVLKEETITATSAEEFQPAYSPDGKEIAYLENRTTLRVINLNTKERRTIMPGKHNYSYSDGDQWYRWSPDSKWFFVSFGQKERLQSDEAGLVSASGNEEIINLTKSGYNDNKPSWSKDGKIMIWASTREGCYGENRGAISGDVFALFLTREAYDRFHLTKEEYELLKEKEKKDKEKANEEGNNLDKKKGGKANVDKGELSKDVVEDLEFDLKNMEDRKERLTVHTSRLSDFVLSDDGEKLYYITRFEGKNNLWVTELRTKETKMLAKLDAGRAEMEMSKDGKFLLVLADGKPVKVVLDDGKTKPINCRGEMVLKKDEERAYIFDHSWRQVREKFYVVDLQGVDWDFYYSEYKKFLPYINNNYDFAEMLSEMLGELNASHTGSGYRHRAENGDETASLGLLYDYSYSGNGIKVAEVLIGGPLDKASAKISAGDIIEKIDGQEVTADIDFYKLLNRKGGKYTLLSVYNPRGNKRWEEVVKPISFGEENQLLYKRWTDSRRDDVDRLSDGKLGYVHVRGMNDESMRTVIEEVLGKHLDDLALIVDTRFNGGGNLHDVLSDFLTGEKYMDIIPHGQNIGYQPGSRWIKPSIVVMGESNYSDAHLFPVAYKIKGGGKTLGMPVPGTGTFVWWETQIDPTLYFGIPMGGWKPIGEPFLENHQMEPDIKVMNEPGKMAEGRDQQIEEAIKELLRK